MTATRAAIDRRLLALRRALSLRPSFGPWALAPTLALGGGFAAALLVNGLVGGALGTPMRPLLAIGAFVAVAAPVWLLVEPRRMRAAREVVAWLNGWEQERWERELGRRLHGLPRATPDLLDRLPDTMGLRPLRIELLATLGRLGEARERLAALPVDTPWQRFECAALAEYIAFCADEPGDGSAMLEASAAVADGDRALAARAMVAVAAARRRAVDGRDASAPLAALRAELGSRPTRYGLGQATGAVALVVLIGIVAGIAVAATSAMLR